MKIRIFKGAGDIMFYKVEKSVDDFYFLDVQAKECLVAGHNQEINLPIQGNITFLKIGEHWCFKSDSKEKIHYGWKSISNKHSHRLNIHKPLKIGSFSITLIPSLPFRPTKPSKGMKYTQDLSLNTSFTIGRSVGCDLELKNPQIDLINTRIIYDNKECFIEDLKSSNGMQINGEKMRSKKLVDGDIITIPSASFMYFQNKLMWATPKDGVRIDIHHVSKQVTDHWSYKPIKILNDISFTIQEGEYVAIVGGSGAGKSTLLDAITGRRKATSGSIFYDLNDYYTFSNCYQKVIGYVPQRDIMHEDLTVEKTLYFYSQIKMKHRLKKNEMESLINEVLVDVSLADKKDLKVSKLSGGQRKRVSIAMELMSNPKVLFLDEPTSGLSPDLDYEIMELLYNLSRKGRTVIVITHNMENVDRCDKIAFLGVGGHLCFFGAPSRATSFFKSRKYGPIFSTLSSKENTLKYKEKFEKTPEYQKMLKEQKGLFEEVRR